MTEFISVGISLNVLFSKTKHFKDNGKVFKIDKICLLPGERKIIRGAFDVPISKRHLNLDNKMNKTLITIIVEELVDQEKLDYVMF